MTSKIFCSIDTTDAAKAGALASSLKGHVAGIKLGLEFFTSHGPQGYKQIAGLGTPMFLDLKLHDIPNTVGASVTSLLPLQPQFMTIHTSGGPAMLKAAAESAAKAGANRPKLLGVTVLTSLNNDDLQAVGVTSSTNDQVARLAKLAKASGLDGVICAPTEIAMLRQVVGQDFVLMVPGIRPKGADVGDQKRVMTPGEAVSAGASYIVIGRPITGAANPVDAAKAINAEYA